MRLKQNAPKCAYKPWRMVCPVGFEPTENAALKGRCLTTWRRAYIKVSFNLYPTHKGACTYGSAGFEITNGMLNLYFKVLLCSLNWQVISSLSIRPAVRSDKLLCAGFSHVSFGFPPTIFAKRLVSHRHTYRHSSFLCPLPIREMVHTFVIFKQHIRRPMNPRRRVEEF